MSTFINLHLLQPFAVSNPNRDDVGSPKSVTYGGTIRGRVSSQAWKRAIRADVERALDRVSYRSTQSNLADVLAERVKARLEVDATDEDIWVAAFIGLSLFTQNGKFDQKKEIDKVRKDYAARATVDITQKEARESKADTLSWFSSEEVDVLATQLVEGWNEIVTDLGADKGSAIVDRFNGIRSDGFGPTEVSIGAFGRMYANAPEAGTDGALAVAHAFTVTPMSHEVDYFTAVDDLRSHGAGHLGLGQFTSGVFYRALSLNVHELDRNCGKLVDEQLDVLIGSCIRAIPSAKQRAALASERPLVVLVEVRCNSETYAAAYLQAMDLDSTPQAAVGRLLGYADRARVFDLPGELHASFVLSPLEDVEIPDSMTRVSSLAELLAKLRSVVKVDR